MTKSYFLVSALKSIIGMINNVQNGKLQIVDDNAVTTPYQPYQYTLDSFLNRLKITAENGIQLFYLDKKQYHKRKDDK